MTSEAAAEIELSRLNYGSKVVAVEPGGADFVPHSARHGRPINLAWTWASPNLEFATIFIGVLAVTAFGMSFWQALAAIVLGNLLSSIAHGVISARGPRYGVPQMVLGRMAFGFRGNALPAILMSIMCGVGWFATNSVSAAWALWTLTGLGKVPSLIIVVIVQVGIGFAGHNLVQAFERFALPVLALIFAATTIVVLAKSHPGNAESWSGGVGGTAGFILTVATVFGYTGGWIPYAADYSRYLPADVSRRAVGLAAGGGLFVATTVLMMAGVAGATIPASTSLNPTDSFTSHLPGWLGSLTLLAIVIGAVCANALNVYSGSMAFVTIGIRLGAKSERAIIAAFFGVVGFVVALLALPDAAHSYEAFLLVVAYWIGPWIGVMLADQLLRRHQRNFEYNLYNPDYRNWGGFLGFVVALVLSVGLFAAQEKFTGLIAGRVPEIGDLTFFVGFLIAFGLYLLLARGQIARERRLVVR